MEQKVKRVLVLCDPNATRGNITKIVGGQGYNVIKASTIKALESLRDSRVTDLVIIGQNTNASVMKEWLEDNCLGVPIIVIVGCECESQKIDHTDNEIKASELDQLPELIKRLIGPAKPLG
jgi:CheY-like chemotaxis protein